MSKLLPLSLDELCERLCQNHKTLIAFHAKPDGDAIGSAFALRELLRLMDIPAICVCADEVPERLSFLVDGVQGSVVPEEGMIMDHERVISVDSAAPEQLGGLYNTLHKYIDIMIDHHAMGTVYADNYIVPEAAATGEIIYDIAWRLLEMGKISEIPPRVINLVYAAICADTGCFKYSNTSPKTFRVAAELVEQGAEREEINRRLFEAKTYKQIVAEGEAARRLTLHNGGKIASVTFPYTSKYSLSLSDEHLETIIEIPRSISGVLVAFSVRQSEDKPIYRVSMRSCGDFDVSRVCALFGGGGHIKAAGCTVEAASIRDAEEMIVRAIRSKMEK